MDQLILRSSIDSYYKIDWSRVFWKSSFLLSHQFIASLGCGIFGILPFFNSIWASIRIFLTHTVIDFSLVQFTIHFKFFFIFLSWIIKDLKWMSKDKKDARGPNHHWFSWSLKKSYSFLNMNNVIPLLYHTLDPTSICL